MSVFVRRTLTSGPPPDLAFGEVAYSDEDQVLHVGRADPVEPPTAFAGNPTDYAPAIAALEAAQTAQGNALAAIPNYGPAIALLDAAQGAQAAALAAIPDYSEAIADLETNQGNQAGAIAALALDVVALETSQAGQDGAISALVIEVDALQAAPPPVTGWDYIGPTEPIAPAVGFTWWERVGSLTVGQWYWLGSLWVSTGIESFATTTFSPTIAQLNANLVINGPFPATPSLTPQTVVAPSIFVTEVQLRRSSGVVTANFDAANKFSLAFEVNFQGFVAANRVAVVDSLAAISHQSFASGTVFFARWAVNRLYTLQANQDVIPLFRVGEIVGAPSFGGGQPRWFIGCSYRRIRQ